MSGFRTNGRKVSLTFYNMIWSLLIFRSIIFHSRRRVRRHLVTSRISDFLKLQLFINKLYINPISINFSSKKVKFAWSWAAELVSSFFTASAGRRHCTGSIHIIPSPANLYSVQCTLEYMNGHKGSAGKIYICGKRYNPF